jgi:hypothetical protein
MGFESGIDILTGNKEWFYSSKVAEELGFESCEPPLR